MKKIFLKKEARIPFTKEGYEKVLADREKFLAERPDAVEHLKKAREMGDLSENGYYKAARSRLSSIDANLRRLDQLRKLGIIVASKNNGIVDIGSSVCISDGNHEYIYTVVGGYESDPMKKTISHISPIGKAIVGKSVGDTVEVKVPRGIVRYKILKIS